MKPRLYLFFLFTVVLFTTGLSNVIGKKLPAQTVDAAADSVIVEPQRALFIFTIEKKAPWHWYQDSTPVNALEYGWWVEFSGINKTYTCGYRLFKHPFAEPSRGSFKQLIATGQKDLASRKTISQTPTRDRRVVVMGAISKREKDVSVESIIKTNKLIIVLREQRIIEEFIRKRPDSIAFYKKIAGQKPVRHTVGVTYISE